MTMELEKYDLQPQQQLAVSLYLKSMNKSQAAKDAGYETTSIFNNAVVKVAINEQLKIRAERLRVGADWVLGEAVKVYHRCMQAEKVLDRDGNATGEFKFDANSAIKALTLVGKHVDIKAFDKPLDTRSDNEVLERLRRGRLRMNKAQLSIDSDDDALNDEEESQDEQLVSFLEPKPSATPSSIEQQAESTEYDSEVVHEIGPSPEEKLKLLLERWKTGHPSGE